MKKLSRFCTVLALALSCALAQAASEVIQLNFRMAQDVLPLAESVLGQDGRATAYGNQRTTGHHNSKEVTEAGPHHCDGSRKCVGINDRGNCIGGIVEAIDELKAQRNKKCRR